MTQTVLFRCRRARGIDRSSGHRLSARHGQPREEIKHERGQIYLARFVGLDRRDNGASMPLAAQQPTNPSSWATTSADAPVIYHRGLWSKRQRPHRERGRDPLDYVAMQSCTSGRNAFFPAHVSVRTGMIPPHPGSLSCGPALWRSPFCSISATPASWQEPPGHHAALPTAHGRIPGLSPRRDAAGELRHQTADRPSRAVP